jgi:hypothetical protein
VAGIPLARAAEHLPAGQQLIGEALQVFPELDFPAILVNEERPKSRGLE